MNKKQLIIIFVVIFLFISGFCLGEELKLKKVTDSQGNTYEVDENGDIYSEGVSKPDRQPVSAENLGYYFNESLMLEINGELDEAFRVYAEILALPEKNEYPQEMNESIKTAKRGIRIRIERLYRAGEDWLKKMLLMYFDIKKSGNGNLEINPKPITDSEEARMSDFASKVADISNGMSPEQVKNILGKPDYVDKETDIHIAGQDTVWTYEHPIIGCAMFIVIFRDGRTEFSSMVVKDTAGKKHYLTLEEFGR
jgi:hypothetical protein